MPGHPIVIPAAVADSNARYFGESGREWLARLPALIAEYAGRWSLALEPPFDGSVNCVAPARLPDGTSAVLKAGFPEPDFFGEAAALRLFDGRKSVRLLDADLECGVYLLERLLPGERLTVLHDDVVETAAAARLMRGLWRPAPAEHLLAAGRRLADRLAPAG